MSTNLVGIDLGTTYSSLCCLDSELRPKPIPNTEGEYATSSVVYLKEDGSGVIVGRDAMEPGIARPERFLTNAKRYLGMPNVGWEVDGVLYDPVDVSAFVLRKLIGDAKLQIGEFREAVITVPAHFTAHQRQLTVTAGQRAGLEKVWVVNEPVASALCYGLGEDGMLMTQLIDDFTVLVYDLGGGTFDLSIVRYGSDLDVIGGARDERRQVRVMASSGEPRLGGIDWDACIVDLIADDFASANGFDPRDDESMVRRLALQAEKCKRALSNPQIDQTTTLVHYQGVERQIVLHRHAFEQLTMPLVEQTRTLTEQLLDTADLSWSLIDRLIPVGGSTRMPMIRRLLNSMAEQGSTIHYLSPDLSVAQGAALYAGIVSGRKGPRVAGGDSARATLGNYHTQIVSGSSLGIVIRGPDGRRVKHVLMPRNTPLPASVTLTVGTARPNQSRASVKVVEGEQGVLGDDEIVCTCTIHDLPPDLPKDSSIDVELTYDADGLLHVVAKHRDTGRAASASMSYHSG